MARKYELKQRAESEEETRLRIVESAVHLHEEVGDAQTTISAIAERAGVSRVTVYRHFPDQRALLSACTSHYFALHPPPDPSIWERVDDPEDRLRVALRELYAFYRRTERMMARAEQDAPANPILAELLDPFTSYLAGIRDSLAAALGRADDLLVVASIGHALAFGTWRSLVRLQGLDDAQAVAIMVNLVRCAPHARDMATHLAGSGQLNEPDPDATAAR
jgi:AcrR family transcriptional regulator